MKFLSVIAVIMASFALTACTTHTGKEMMKSEMKEHKMEEKMSDKMAKDSMKPAMTDTMMKK